MVCRILWGRNVGLSNIRVMSLARGGSFATRAPRNKEAVLGAHTPRTPTVEAQQKLETQQPQSLRVVYRESQHYFALIPDALQPQPALSPSCLQPTQRLQNPLIKEYALNNNKNNRIPNMI